MMAFARLVAALDESNRVTAKVAALCRYWRAAEPADAAWAVYFLTGRKLRQAVPAKKLRAWAAESAGLPAWLFEECYHAVGDLAETIAGVVPGGGMKDERSLADWVTGELLPLRTLDEVEQRRRLLGAWAALDRQERFVWNKLITGAFRVGVSQQLVTRSLAEATGVAPAVLARRLMGDWEPTAEFYQALVAGETRNDDSSRPYPFFLAHPLTEPPAELGPIDQWQAEWKWDGIRCQAIRRSGTSFIWSRGEELVTPRFPELEPVIAAWPDGTVIDGELLPWRDGRPMSFGDLQRRLGRRIVGRKLLAEVPVALMAYDLVEFDGKDLRSLPLTERRRRLEELASARQRPEWMVSPVVVADSWEALADRRAESRGRRVEGLMLKRKSSAYGVGRPRGDWWKWKIEPMSVDAVLIYAQRGSGRRASLYTDYTFALWHQGQLVPVAKAYSGLTDAEIQRVDAFVRGNTREKFGPVRTVAPELVFEIGFEGVAASSRHKSGVAVRFPRILRWREDKSPEQADQLSALTALLGRENFPQQANAVRDVGEPL